MAVVINFTAVPLDSTGDSLLWCYELYPGVHTCLWTFLIIKILVISLNKNCSFSNLISSCYQKFTIKTKSEIMIIKDERNNSSTSFYLFLNLELLITAGLTRSIVPPAIQKTQKHSMPFGGK